MQKSPCDGEETIPVGYCPCCYRRHCSLKQKTDLSGSVVSIKVLDNLPCKATLLENERNQIGRRGGLWPSHNTLPEKVIYIIVMQYEATVQY